MAQTGKTTSDIKVSIGSCESITARTVMMVNGSFTMSPSELATMA